MKGVQAELQRLGRGNMVRACIGGTVRGLESVDLSGFDVLRLSKEPDATRRAWDLVVDGVLDGYRARRALSVGADEIDSYLGVRTVARGGDCSRSVSVVTDPVPSRRGRRRP